MKEGAYVPLDKGERAKVLSFFTINELLVHTTNDFTLKGRINGEAYKIPIWYEDGVLKIGYAKQKGDNPLKIWREINQEETNMANIIRHLRLMKDELGFQELEKEELVCLGELEDLILIPSDEKDQSQYGRYYHPSVYAGI